jgi:hypothetical protein
MGSCVLWRRLLLDIVVIWAIRRQFLDISVAVFAFVGAIASWVLSTGGVLVSFTFLFVAFGAQDTPQRPLFDLNYTAHQEQEYQMSGNKVVLRKLFLFSLALFFIPVGMYFFFDAYMTEALLGPNSKYRVMLNGGVAALSVNVILGMYVYMALNEEDSFGRADEQKQD